MMKYILLVLTVLLSGCDYFYSYRQEDDKEWVSVGDYEIHVEIFRGQVLIISLDEVNDKVKYFDSTVVLKPYFNRYEKLTVIETDLGNTGRNYSLKGIKTWQSSAPLHIHMEYDIDSNGIIVKKKHDITLEKHTRWVFPPSVH